MYGRFYTILCRESDLSAWSDMLKELTADEADRQVEKYRQAHPGMQYRKKCCYSGSMRFMAAR